MARVAVGGGFAGKTTLHAEEQAIERKHQELETARRLQELSEKLSEAHEDLRNEREVSRLLWDPTRRDLVVQFDLSKVDGGVLRASLQKASELRRNREDLERRLKEKDSALKAQSAELETARAETVGKRRASPVENPLHSRHP